MHISINCVVYCSPTERFQVGFSFGLLIISFFPSTGMLFRVGFVVAERLDAAIHRFILYLANYRVLYLPSLGFCLLVSIGCKRLHSVLPQVSHVCVCVLACRKLYKSCNFSCYKSFFMHL